MREKYQNLLGDILLKSLDQKSGKLSTKEQKELEALQKLLDGFKSKK